MKTALCFRPPDGHAQEQIDAILADSFPFEIEEPVSEVWTFYDTFDWRLFNKSLVLRHSGQITQLLALSTAETLLWLPGSAPPRFALDLPEGASRNLLGSHINARALLRLAVCQVFSQTYRILNRDDKTVARLNYTEAHGIVDGAGQPLGSYLTILPVRGYPKYARQLSKRLTLVEPVSSLPGDIYLRTLEANGRVPRSYSGKLDLSLSPDMRADEAMRLILRRLLEIMRANEAGIKADVDVEFLHDFRIAVRRTRSALSQVKNVFPEDTTAHYRREFRWLGKLSNELRDLDVYLLAEPAYLAMLPESMCDDVMPLFDYLRSRRAQALLEVVDGLNSEKCESILADWETFLNQSISEEYAAANAAVPIVNLARKRIYRKYRRIIKDGNYILTHMEDELLHALRLECKKLRYLLEFFASLFPAKKVARLIKQLKRLQDYLGDFSDLSVQQEYLMRISRELPGDDADTRCALVATGFLVATLADSQQAVKADFAKTFNKFASKANQDQYRMLFAAKGEGEILMTTLALYSNKGGVGKTAAAANLAYLAAKAGNSTLICDLDPQASATFYFRVKPRLKRPARGLVKRGKPVDRSIKGTDYENLDLLPADFSHRKLDITFNKLKRPRRRLDIVLAPLKKEYDLIILDCPPTINLVAENIINTADMLLEPVIPTTLSVRTHEQLLAFLEESGRGSKKLSVFFSMVDGRRNLHQEIMIALRAQFDNILETTIPYLSKIEQMGITREPVPAFAPGSRTAQAYIALWSEIQRKIFND